MMGRPARLSTVAKRGDRRATLEALRDHLARAMEEASVGVKAQIAGQLRQVLEDLEGLTEPEESRVDELAAKRSARRRKPGADASSGP